MESMTIQQQCCTPTQGERLKELGVKQKSLFYWHPYFKVPVFGESFAPHPNFVKIQVCNDKANAYSAFTVAELGQMLPCGYDTFKTPDNEWCAYIDGGDGVRFPTEASARAALILRLIESGATNITEINDCL
jgi:hypothetical protein